MGEDVSNMFHLNMRCKWFLKVIWVLGCYNLERKVKEVNPGDVKQCGSNSRILYHSRITSFMNF